jgi:hypothetical protein
MVPIAIMEYIECLIIVIYVVGFLLSFIGSALYFKYLATSGQKYDYDSGLLMVLIFVWPMSAIVALLIFIGCFLSRIHSYLSGQ